MVLAFVFRDERPRLARDFQDREAMRLEDFARGGERPDADVAAIQGIDVGEVVLVLHEARHAGVEDEERLRLRERRQVARQLRHHGRREMLDHLDATAGLEGGGQAFESSYHIVRVCRAMLRLGGKRLDAVEDALGFGKIDAQCVEQPSGAGADVEEPVDGNARIEQRLGDARQRGSEAALLRRGQLRPPVGIVIFPLRLAAVGGGKHFRIREDEIARPAIEIRDLVDDVEHAGRPGAEGARLLFQGHRSDALSGGQRIGKDLPDARFAVAARRRQPAQAGRRRRAQAGRRIAHKQARVTFDRPIPQQVAQHCVHRCGLAGAGTGPHVVEMRPGHAKLPLQRRRKCRRIRRRRGRTRPLLRHEESVLPRIVHALHGRDRTGGKARGCRRTGLAVANHDRGPVEEDRGLFTLAG